MRSFPASGHTNRTLPKLEGGKEPLPVCVQEIGGHTSYHSLWMPWGPEEFALMKRQGKSGKVGVSIVIIPTEGSEHPEISVKLVPISVGN